jgi:hypothetical protein
MVQVRVPRMGGGWRLQMRWDKCHPLLKTWVYVPTSIHYLFSRNASYALHYNDYGPPCGFLPNTVPWYSICLYDMREQNNFHSLIASNQLTQHPSRAGCGRA